MYNQPKEKEKFQIGDALKLSDEEIMAERSEKNLSIGNSSSLNLYELWCHLHLFLQFNHQILCEIISFISSPCFFQADCTLLNMS